MKIRDACVSTTSHLGPGQLEAQDNSNTKSERQVRDSLIRSRVFKRRRCYLLGKPRSPSCRQKSKAELLHQRQKRKDPLSRVTTDHV